jgi:hypothetical protein
MLFKMSKRERPERPQSETVENNERPDRPEGERPDRFLRLVLRASGSAVEMIDSRISTDKMAVILRVPSTFQFVIEKQNRDGEWDPDLGGTFNNDFLVSNSFVDMRTDSWNISGTLFSDFEGREKRSDDTERPDRPEGKRKFPNRKADATLVNFAIGQNSTTHEAGLVLGFEHNGKNMLYLRSVLENLNGQTDYKQFTSTMSIAEAFTAIMAGNNIKEGTITMLNDLTTSLKVSDCGEVLKLQHEMARARRNYADEATIEKYTQQLNQLVSGSMTCKDLNQQIPMKMQTVKIGIDYWAVPALNFADENGYVPLTDMLDKESMEYMINIVDHAAEPMQQSMIVVRQLMRFIQTITGTYKEKQSK